MGFIHLGTLTHTGFLNANSYFVTYQTIFPSSF